MGTSSLGCRRIDATPRHFAVGMLRSIQKKNPRSAPRLCFVVNDLDDMAEKYAGMVFDDVDDMVKKTADRCGGGRRRGPLGTRGHNYMGHNYMGPSGTRGHNYMGHNYIGRALRVRGAITIWAITI